MAPNPNTSANPSTPEAVKQEELLIQAGDSLIKMGEDTGDGWRYESEIQSPNHHTDRDVGAASVGMGFLVLAEQYPDDKKWISAAEHTAEWLLKVAKQDEQGNKYWPDYVNSDDDVSEKAYTSFDDGTIGVSDFLWQLYEKTEKDVYKDASISALEWTFAQAQDNRKKDDPNPVYRWQWDTNNDKSAYVMGMGMGAVGIVHTLATYYERLQDSDPQTAEKCKAYIDGTLRYIKQTRDTLGEDEQGGDARALPETGVIGGEYGDTAMNSGYLSGAAGAAFMYLKLYEVFHDKEYLEEADSLFDWLEDTQDGPMVVMQDGSVAWKLALDPQDDNNEHYATGVEEGAAGIGWTYLQAYKLTGNEHYLEMAKKTGDWLNTAAVRIGDGAAWREFENYQDGENPVFHVNLNNGAAGIGMFLVDLAEVSKDEKYMELAKAAERWMRANAKLDSSNNVNVTYWQDNGGSDEPYERDPSWHWGNAGNLAFLARMLGGKVNIAGNQHGL